MTAVRKAIAAAKKLRAAVDELEFSAPVTHVYNPLDYAWKAHEAYLRKLNPDGVRVLFVGMNPGPWGMAQTGVPFGEVAAVRDWLGIEMQVSPPEDENPKRPIEGFACQRSEVSGRRLWGLFQDRFCTSEAFFREHFVANYCPLVFMEASGKNRTPDKLPAAERVPLVEACDVGLKSLLKALDPTWAVGVGRYAEQCLRRVAADQVQVTSILHPSPASPAANRGWSEAAKGQLATAGVWSNS